MSLGAVRSRRVLTPEGLRPATVEFAHGRITALRAFEDAPAGAHDAGELVVMPGLVDTHVHVNEPGRTEWEGIETATAAAAAGGVTTLLDMPLNSTPATTTVAALATKRAAIEGRCRVDVGLLGGVVPGHEDELAGLWAGGVRGFKCFLVPSGVEDFAAADERTLEAALPRLAALGAPLMVHAEWPSALLPAPPSTRSYVEWAASRPAGAEAEAIERIAHLAARHGARVHIVHVSSAEGVAAVAAARARGVALTAETCPHYLTFTADEVPEGATEFKCAPPLRTTADREALWAALEDGTLAMVVSDHSPCPPSLKARDTGDFVAAWGGIASLQLGLAAVWTGLQARGLGLDRLARWMSAEPARLAGLAARKGALEPGRDADLVLWSPEERETVHAARLRHRHPLTPYEGRSLAGVVHTTYLRGQRIHVRGADLEAVRGRCFSPEDPRS